MGFSVNTNLDALNTYKNLNMTQMSLSNSLAKLSSGLRINNAGDDAAGLTIATSLGSQVSGLQQASRNAQDGTSVVQTADGGLSQAQALLGRLRDLAVQAGNDSNSASARLAIKTEATSITSELSRIGTSVNFNGKTLLNQSSGAASVLTFQVGADGNAASQITVDLSKANLNTVSTALTAGTSYSATLYNAGTGATAPAAGTYDGAYSFTSTVSGVATTITTSALAGTTGFQSVADKLNADSAFSSKFSATVNSSGQLAVTAQDGGQVTLDATSSSRLATTGTGAGAGAGAAATAGSATIGLDFSTAAGAQAAINSIDTQINNVSAARANIGALENRFNSAVATISTSMTNLTAAKSRITDVDMASEMVNYSRANILSQSGTAMLAQANSLPQLALKLLQG